MKGLSLCRQISVEDIHELTPRRGAITRRIKLNKPPQLEDVDDRIGQLVDLLAILDQSLNRLEEEYFREAVDEDSATPDAHPDEAWASLRHEYAEEIDEKDTEYDKLLERFPIEPT